MGEKSEKVTQQVMARSEIDGKIIEMIYLVIPKLITNCIIGIDVLKPLKTQIDFETKSVKMKYLKDELKIPIINKRQASQEKSNLNDEIFEHKILTLVKRWGKIENSQIELTDENFKDKQIKQITNEIIEETVLNCKILNNEQRTKLKGILTKHQKIFDKTPGRINDYEHELKLKSNTIIKAKHYPISMRDQKQVDVEIEKMLEAKIIRRSDSPYINPMLPVKKSDGTARVCLDARELNKALEDDPEKHLDMQEIFQRCAGVKVMTTIDLTSSFWQIPLEGNSKKYTAFLHRGKYYEYNTTPFGLNKWG